MNPVWEALKWFVIGLLIMGASVLGALFLSVRFDLPVWPPFVGIALGLLLAVLVETYVDHKRKGRLML